MDQQTIAQLLGNYGEFVGSIAVFATLVYLSVQVRQSHKSTKADVNLRLNDEIANLNRDVYLYPEFAALVHKSYQMESLDELSGEEAQRMSRYFATVLNRARQIYELNKEQVINQETGDMGSTYLKMFLGRPIFVSAWTTLKDWYPTEFADYVEQLVEEAREQSRR